MSKYHKLLKWLNKEINQLSEMKSIEEVMGMSEVRNEFYRAYILALNSVKAKIAMLEQSEKGILGTGFNKAILDELTKPVNLKEE